MARKSKDDKLPPLITRPLSELLRLPAGQVDVNAFDAAATPGFPGDKQDAAAITDALAPELSDLQERLFAVGRAQESTSRTILVVLQGMDASGKGGVIRHAIGMVDPQGVKIKAFKVPTEEERAHHYLWRIEANCRRGASSASSTGPSTRRSWLCASTTGWTSRYGVSATTRSMPGGRLGPTRHGDDQVLLNISLDRAEGPTARPPRDPTKHWKYNPGVVDGGQSGPRTWRPTKPYWSAAIPNARRGMSFRPIASGIEIGPLPSCWSSSCARLTCAGRWLTSTLTMRRLE